MANPFLFFLLTSFLGSLPPGLVNTGIAFRVLENKNWHSWWLLAVAAELPHVALAIWLSRHQMEIPALLPSVRWASPLLLLLVGILYFRKKPAGFEPISSRSFWLINLLNPAGVPFWWASLQTRKEVLELDWFYQLPMAGLGAGLAFLLYVQLAGWIVTLPNLQIRRFYQFASLGFLFLGLLQFKNNFFPSFP